ncbi:MAG: VWA domain-containing protein [Candidatus Woesearchaeota archaeon]
MVQFLSPDLLFLIPAVILLLVFLMNRTFVGFRNREEYKGYLANRKKTRMLMLISRIAIFTLLIIALAGPFISQEKLISGSPKLKIFVDKSDSMSLFDTGIADTIMEQAKKEIPVEMRTIAVGNRSALGDSILNYAQGDESILLVSDGNSNYGRSLGDVMLFANMLNTTISALDIQTEKSDALVKVLGPMMTTVNVETELFAVIEEAGEMNSYMLTVEVDDQRVLEQAVSSASTYSFKVSLSEGYHRIKAEISADDYFKENNVFYKVIKVEPKPKVLFMTRTGSPLQQVMGSLYDLSIASALPSDYQKYSAIVLNDYPSSSIDAEALGEYVADGNGIVVVGGKNSYDRGSYKNSVFEGLLPAVVGTGGEEARKDVNIVVLIDISGTSSELASASSDLTKADVSKALTLQLFKDLKPDDKVAVIAFHTKQILVSGLSALSQKTDLVDKVSRIYSERGPGTLIDEAIIAARKLIAPLSGSKNIILISDGIPGGPASNDIAAAGIAAQNGIKVYAIQVGDDSYGAQHLQDIVQAANGIYMKADESSRVKVIFGEGAPEKDNSYRMEIVNGYHFITKNLVLEGQVTGFNFVVPKQNADLLVSTGDGHALLTVWRFGLGRIASLSTDDGSAWAGQMLNSRNSKLLSKTVNWAVGDLSRNKEFDVSMKDTYLGEPVEVNVISNALPIDESLKFSKIGEKLYTSSFTPEKTGFEKLLNAIVAVNYNRELSAVGTNADLQSLVIMSRGEFFKPDDVKGIIDKVKTDARRMQTTKVSYTWIFVAAALAIFLIELTARKIAENRNISK